jgi:CRISPR-associated endonuclease Csn1
MGKRILGLDLGTNSIGWGVVDDLGNGQFELVKRGVHIFQEGVKIEKGNESSKAAERTGYRSARRLKFRRKLRKIETLKALSEYGYCPALSEDELKAWQSKKIYPENGAFRDWCKTSDPNDKESGVYENPYYYRWLAASTTLNLADEADRFKLGRAFYHMAQRRGFKSNRLESTKESDGIVKKDISELSEKMGRRTLGQYFWEDC